MFANKLDYLMNLSNTSNAALGRALNFDPSYISRIRSGKRGLPKHLPFLEPAASYFSRKLNRPIQKASLESVVCPGQVWPDEVTESEQLLISWLSGDHRSAEHRVSRFLAVLGERVPIPAVSEINSPPNAGDISASCYYDNKGKREAVLLFLRDLCAEDKPFTLCLYSDEDFTWFFEDPAFVDQCSELVLLLARRGTLIRVIHTISQQHDEMLLALQKWLPLYITGSVEAYSSPEVSRGSFRRTLLIAEGHSAVTTTSTVGCSCSLTALVREPEAVSVLNQEYLTLLSFCTPMVQTFRKGSGDDLWPVLHRFNSERASWIIAQRLPSGFTMPLQTAESISLRGGRKMADFHRSASLQFTEILDAGLPITELLHLPPLRDVLAGKVHIPLCDYFDMPDLIYTPHELRDHLLSVIALLKQRSNYQVIITDGIPFGTLIYAKKGYGCIVARLVPPLTVFFSEEPRATALLWTYLEHFSALGQSRESVIQMLDAYVNALEKP